MGPKAPPPEFDLKNNKVALILVVSIYRGIYGYNNVSKLVLNTKLLSTVYSFGGKCIKY